MFAARTLNRPAVLWCALALTVAALYLFGLGGPYAPTNGDEMVYIHIARLTAASGHWLPLRSELLDMRNTKPPLLIWQALLVSDWGQNWSLWTLRLPSVAYTFASAALLGLVARRMGASTRSAALAVVLYLLFFSSFRYGRAYLTSAPETFWLALPLWWVLWRRARSAAPQELAPGALGYTLIGLCLGVGAAYKSFALIAPSAATLWIALLPRPWNARALVRSTAGLGWSCCVGLALFSLWFVLDPDPAAVWREFVLTENAGKLRGPEGYWYAAWYGAYPMWTQLFAYPANAGLLVLPALGLQVLAVRAAFRPPKLRPEHALLLAWLLVWLVVFTIPSQRSERYLIPAMPALALSMALLWERIARVWFWLTLLLLLPALLLLARIAWVIGTLDIGTPALACATVAACALGGGVALAGLLRARWTRNATLLVCTAVYASFNLMVAPLSGAAAGYTPEVQQVLQGRKVAVPNGFTGQFEHYHFVLAGAQLTPYDAEGRNTGVLYPELAPAARQQRLLASFDAVVWLQDSSEASGPACLPRCRVLAQRWHVKSRHRQGEVTWENVWYPMDWLFSREWLLLPAEH